MNLTNKRAQAGIQMFLLITMTFAVSFMLYEADSVEAASVLSNPSVCCEKTVDGDYCLNANATLCDSSMKTAPTSCESTSYCKLGTCYDSSEGICMENVPQRTCTEQGGTWDEKDMEEVPQCQLGCCLIGDQAALVSLVRCKKLSSFYGIEIDYRKDLVNEVACIAEAQSQEMGACVYTEDYERTCEFTTKKDCDAQEIVEVANGTNVTTSTEKRFYEDYLCSAEELNTACARQASTSCYAGKVYWEDSCGNRENVYSSNKDLSWNNGRIAEPEEVCSPNDGSDENCGNCDYFLGTRCGEWEGVLGIGKPSDSDYVCKRTDCTDRWGNERMNGESWCVYDDETSGGKDPVGSRHFKEVCADGEVIVEPCADYRNEICISGVTETSDGNYETAICRVNRWQDCLAITDEDDCKDFDNRDCMWLPSLTGLNIGASSVDKSSTSTGTTFSNPTASNASTKSITSLATGNAILTGNALFGSDDEDEDEKEVETSTNRPDGICVPDIPPGLKFWDSSSQSQCAQASATCVIKYEESALGGKKCIENCECEEDNWAIAANQVCTAMGDCGGYTNYAGDWSGDGYEWVYDGEDREFSQNQINQIEITASSPGKSANYAWGIPVALGVTTLIAGIKTTAVAGAPVATSTLMPINTAGMVGGLMGKAGGGASTLFTQISQSWLASGALNALALGGIIWGGAALLGADNADAIGAGAMTGLFAGSVAEHFATAPSLVSFSELTPGMSLSKDITLGGGEILKSGTVLTEESITNIAAGSNLETVSVFQHASLAQYAPLINIGVTIAVAIAVYYLLKKDYSEITVEFKCLPWQAPSGSAKCEECNDETLPCSEYRCKSLGASCELVNAGTEDETCVSVNPNDSIPPIIQPNEVDLTYGHEYYDVKTSPPGAGFKIKNTNSTSGCIKPYTPVEFGIFLDEPGQCKIDVNHTTAFEDMGYWFGGKNLYAYNHTEYLSLPSPSALEANNLTVGNGKDWVFYIRCMDKAGNANEAEYALEFCVDDSPDMTAPEIKATSIQNEGCISADTDSALVDFYVNEPATCKWSFEDQSYTAMQNTMSCNSKLYQVNSLQLYTCKANLTGIARDNTKFYVRCQDQPDATENDRNENKQSYEFTLRGSSPIKLMDIQPNTTVFGGTNPAPVELYAKTKFGCEEGKSICYYSTTGNEGDYIMFYDSGNDDGVSTQRLDLTAGKHKYYVKCVDAGGNSVVDSTNFNVDIDTDAPVIARIYEEETMLKIVTVRNSECSYSMDNCDFSFAEGTEMPYANTTNHVVEWKQDQTYYIKCRDEFKNEEADCSAIVKPTKNFLSDE